MSNNKDEWALKLIETMREKSKQPSNMMIANVVSTSPLRIEIAGQTISRYLYVNQALLLSAGNSFADKPIETRWFDFLKRWHNAYRLNTGDKVVVLQSDVSFYVLAKVVSA